MKITEEITFEEYKKLVEGVRYEKTCFRLGEKVSRTKREYVYELMMPIWRSDAELITKKITKKEIEIERDKYNGYVQFKLKQPIIDTQKQYTEDEIRKILLELENSILF